MPERTSYAHGIPSWIDLSTPDTDGARAFYGGLFGWTFEEEPAGDQGTYVMCRKGAKAVAGMMRQDPQQAAQGVPPMWNSYVTVDDVEATVGKVASAGGQVVAPPFDVMTSGRMAVVQDPTGAFLSLWEARDHIGAELVNEHGALTWNELTTADVDAAARFYEAVLGWKANYIEEMDYTGFQVDGDDVAGAMKPQVEGIPPHWAVYLAVDDCDATLARAGELGGEVFLEPMDVPPGRFGGIRDPQGAHFFVLRLAQPPAS